MTISGIGESEWGEAHTDVASTGESEVDNALAPLLAVEHDSSTPFRRQHFSCTLYAVNGFIALYSVPTVVHKLRSSIDTVISSLAPGCNSARVFFTTCACQF